MGERSKKVEELRDHHLATVKDNMKLRELLWLHHGHSEALYGDDGEMQCNHPDCVIDFKRDSVEKIVERFNKARYRRMVEFIRTEGVGNMRQKIEEGEEMSKANKAKGGK